MCTPSRPPRAKLSSATEAPPRRNVTLTPTLDFSPAKPRSLGWRPTLPNWTSSRAHQKMYGKSHGRNHYFIARARVSLSLLENQCASLSTFRRVFGYPVVKQSLRRAERSSSNRLQHSSALVFMRVIHL